MGWERWWWWPLEELILENVCEVWEEDRKN